VCHTPDYCLLLIALSLLLLDKHQVWTVLLSGEQESTAGYVNYCQLFAERAAMTLSIQCGACHTR
jgi:hypothetical protein